MRTEPLGIDISRWQQPINWDKFSAQPVEFVAMRATIGVRYLDAWFKSSYEMALHNRIPRTAYHVVRPDCGAKEQVDWFMQAMGDAVFMDIYSDLPLVLDCEVDAGKSPAIIGQVIYDCAHYLEDITGKKPIIYSRTSWVNPYIGAKEWLNDYDWWMAQYGWAGKESQVVNIPLPPTIDRERLIIHQTTDRLKGAKYGASSKQIDGNRWVSEFPLSEYIREYRGENSEPVDAPEPVTDGHKLNTLWDAHEELH